MKIYHSSQTHKRRKNLSFTIFFIFDYKKKYIHYTIQFTHTCYYMTEGPEVTMKAGGPSSGTADWTPPLLRPAGRAMSFFPRLTDEKAVILGLAGNLKMLVRCWSRRLDLWHNLNNKKNRHGMLIVDFTK